MTIVFVLYCVLIACLPTFLFNDSLIGRGLVSLFAAILVAILAATRLSSNLRGSLHLLNPVVLAGLVGSLLVMVFQMLPMASSSLINPIWTSAAAALGEQPAGSVTIDTGITLRAICRVTIAIAIMLLTVAITVHRPHAEKLLSLLITIATLVSLALIKSCFPLPDVLHFLPPIARSDAAAISVFGFVLTNAAVIRSYERSRQASSRPAKTEMPVGVKISVGLAAALINLFGVICSEDATTIFAALFGVGVLLAVLAVRKGRFGSWGQAGAIIVLLLAFAIFMTTMPGRAESDLIVRMTEDARPLGVGAGALTALTPIYGQQPLTDVLDVSAVAIVIVEMGRPFLWMVALFAAISVAILLRRSLMRGRDYVYSAAGAGCIAALFVSATSSGGMLSFAPSILLSATIGLAIAQSKSDRSSSVPASQQHNSKLSAPPLLSWVSGVFALVLVAQGGWTVLPEALRPARIDFPSDQGHATVARSEQDRVNRSAEMAVVRGDLWAESAFTYAGMLWTEQAFEIETDSGRNAKALESLSRTLRYSPHRGDAWLMWAWMCERLKLQACNVGAALKMSYYTAPDQMRLLPARLARVLHAKDISSDDELADMARRDIRFVLTRSTTLRPMLLAAYRSASPAGKRLVEQVITLVEPGYLNAVRAGLT